MLKRGNEYLVEREHYFYVPLLMKGPELIPTSYEFELEGKAVDTDNVVLDVRCTFACRADPRESEPWVFSAETFRNIVRMGVERELKEILYAGGKPLTVSELTEKLLQLPSQFHLSHPLGDNASASLKRFVVSIPK